jgi:hypothetical protein
MLKTAELTREGKLHAPAIDAVQVDAAQWQAALAATSASDTLAALAIIAGTLHLQEAASALLPLLDRDGLLGRAAAWALGSLPSTPAQGAAAETALLSAIATGTLDVRDNAYQALAVLSARGFASATLAEAMAGRIQAEIERAQSGGSGLGEQVCRVLAILGSPRLPELIQRVIENDRYCDRFELQRLRKAVEDGGTDRGAIKALSAPWRSVFAEQLYQEPVTARPDTAAGAKGPTQPTAIPHAGHQAGVASPTPGGSHAAASPATAHGNPDEGPGEGPGDGTEPPGPAIVPIDWKAFAASPEAKALPAQVQQMASQLGPLLEQLSARAVHAALADLSGQEFAALLLQVLPQALPPQHVQMALSPPAVNAYQAIAKYLSRTGLATNGPELIDAVKMVRQELTNQIRQSGILGGPDYKDPDEKPALKP